MNHLMIDIETLGQSPHAVVLSCALVAFNKDTIINQKEWILNVEQQIQQGRKIDYDTVSWWMKQSDDARKLFHNKFQTSLTYFANEAVNFFTKECGPQGRLWGNGASFDIPIIETLIKKNGQQPPWKYFHHRCYRTMKAIYKMDEGVPFEGTKHGALPDALHQAKCLQILWAKQPELEA